MAKENPISLLGAIIKYAKEHENAAMRWIGGVAEHIFRGEMDNIDPHQPVGTIRNPIPAEKEPEPKKKREKSALEEKRIEAQQQPEIDFSALSAALAAANGFSVKDVWMDVIGGNEQQATKYHVRFDALKASLDNDANNRKALEKMQEFIGDFSKAGITALKSLEEDARKKRTVESDFMKQNEIKPLIDLQKACDGVLKQMQKGARR